MNSVQEGGEDDSYADDEGVALMRLQMKRAERAGEERESWVVRFK